MTLPEFETIALAIDGPLGRITLNRPDKLNAFNNSAIFVR